MDITKKTTPEVTKVVVVKPATVVYNLSLTEEELLTLRALVGNVGGGVDKTKEVGENRASPARQFVNDLYNAIEKARPFSFYETYRAEARKIPAANEFCNNQFYLRDID